MQTESRERTLRAALRETLDRELGPDPAWIESPAARRVAELERRQRWPLRALAVAAVIGAGAAVALLAGAPNRTEPAANGWVAFTVAQDGPAGADPDVDIWFTALGQQPRRVVGSDHDDIDQVCPAFSPDGRSLAYGSIHGIRGEAGYWGNRNAALVVAEVAEDGTVAERLRIDVGDGLPPPCPVWSPAGERLAFGVPLTSAINPSRSGEGSAVWVLRPADRDIIVIPDLLATDLEWAPDGSVLAIIGGVRTASGVGVIDGLQDGQIHLYELSTRSLRTLNETLGATGLTWSPDGRRLAFAGRGDEPSSDGDDDSRSTLRVVDVATGEQQLLVTGFSAIHGIGPVWSPDGKTLAFQRRLRAECCERHEVVLVAADGGSGQTGSASQVVMPSEHTTTRGSRVELWPWRVTWSPDGAYLLYVAWTYPEKDSEATWVVAVPTERDAPAIVLADAGDIGAYDFADDAMSVPIQVWQPRPEK